MTDLHDLSERDRKAETTADGAEILREAIEQLIKDGKPVYYAKNSRKYFKAHIDNNVSHRNGFNLGVRDYKTHLLTLIKFKETN